MRVAYLLDRFPIDSEQFIRREVEAMLNLGVLVELAQLRPASDLDRPFWRLTEGLRCLTTCSLHTQLIIREAGALLRDGVPLSDVAKRVVDAVRIAHQLSAQRPDLVHAHFGNAPATTARLVAAALEVPWGVSVHARDLFVEHQFFEERMRTAAYIVACTETGAERARTLLRSSLRPTVRTIYHGVEQRPERDQAVDHSRIVAAGRLVKKKGFDVLLEALARLAARGVAFSAKVIGDGPERFHLRAKLARLGLNHCVRLCPWMSFEAFQRELEISTVLAVPSAIDKEQDRDGIPNVLLEALACGLPVVASNLDTIAEVGHTGAIRVVAPNSPVDLADALQSVLTCSVERTRLSRVGRETACRMFDLDRNVSVLRDVMQSAISLSTYRSTST